MAIRATYINMTVIKGRSRSGYKLETKTSVCLTTYNFAMEKHLQELLSIFGLLIGPYVSVVVVASSHVYGETGEMSA